MEDNPEVFKDSDMNFIYDRIHAVAQNKLEMKINFLLKCWLPLIFWEPISQILMLLMLDLNLLVSLYHLTNFHYFKFLRRDGMNYSMEDLFNLMK